MGEYDDYYADALAEEMYIEEVIENSREEIIRDFQDDRLSSFYEAHKGLEQPALKFIDRAIKLKDVDTTASFIMAYAASEYVVKKVLLEPVVAGFIHDEEVDEVIAPIVMQNKGFLKILFSILERYDVKVGEEIFLNTGRTIKQEWNRQNGLRNAAVHRCEMIDITDTELAISLAQELSGDVFTKLLSALGIRYSG